jgi:predicted nucleic acid-binding protein
MSKGLAILDTSVLILLLTKKVDESEEEVRTEIRREAVKQCLREMQPKWQFGIPTVVVAELTRGTAAKKEVQRLVSRLGAFKILALTFEAGCVAADMARESLSKKPHKLARGAIKFDTLICATADAHRAARIITENPSDFAQHVATVDAPIEIIVPSSPPAKGQMNVFQMKPSKK